ncbi:MAG: ATP-binding protein [Ignavibacteriales bacterium]
MEQAFRRPVFGAVLKRIMEPRRFIQVLAGPRQTGKTTLARQVMEAVSIPSHYASADEPSISDNVWLHAQWEHGRLKARDGGERGALLVLDEIHKITGWSEAVKRLWDEDTVSGVRLKALLLGSSPLLVHRGLSDSLAGRFELNRITHWSYGEMKEAFGWGLEEYLFFGGYPGAAPLTGEPDRWARYVLDSLIETTLARDILLLTRVEKPALLRVLFRLGCDYSGQVLSYQKMLGQMQDAGNTTTLAHYLELLSGAGMLTGLQKYAGSRVRLRASSPKLLALNTALMTVHSRHSLRSARADSDFWGRLVETAVGAHLVNGLSTMGSEVQYWRDRGKEVDYIVTGGREVVAFEVTSGRRKRSLPGLQAFRDTFGPHRCLLVGGQGIPLDEFLLTPAEQWLE